MGFFASTFSLRPPENVVDVRKTTNTALGVKHSLRACGTEGGTPSHFTTQTTGTRTSKEHRLCQQHDGGFRREEVRSKREGKEGYETAAPERTWQAVLKHRKQKAAVRRADG